MNAIKKMSAFAPPFLVLICCLSLEMTAQLEVWITLLAPTLLLIVIMIASRYPLLPTVLSAFIGWIYLGFWVPSHIRPPLPLEELVLRNVVWFFLIFGAPGFIHLTRHKLKRALDNQATEYEKSRLDLQVSESRARGLIEYAYDAFIAMDGHGNIKDWNRQAEETFGWMRADVLNRQLREVIIPERYREAHQKGMARYLKTGEGPVLNKRIEITALHRLGHEIPVELTIYPLKQADGILFGSFLHDISERKRNEESAKKFADELEEKIKERTQELSLAYDQAKIANRLKDEFLATVSHEIRTPLGVILGYCDLLLHSHVDESDRKSFLEIVDRNAKAQMQLVTDLLDVSKIISGKMTFEQGVFDLNKVVLGAIESVKIAAAAKDINLNVDAETSRGLVRGDAGRIQQVLWNLLSNAVKFTPKNGSIKLSLKYVGASTQISVSDNGKGIDPVFLPYVFERFRQEDATTTRSYGGLGIGLAIVRNIVEAHGGTCEVSSPGVNQGATFTINFPIPFQSIAASSHTSKSLSQNQDRSLKGRRILIVDDQADNRTMLREWLHRAGALVTEAESAESAFAAFLKSAPDALVSDISMPNEDGYQLIHRIRTLEKERGEHVPAVAFTAHARADEKDLAIRSGYDLHIARPTEAQNLIGQLSELLEAKEHF
jgi:PAS domain S-box-containing protein